MEERSQPLQGAHLRHFHLRAESQFQVQRRDDRSAGCIQDVIHLRDTHGYQRG